MTANSNAGQEHPENYLASDKDDTNFVRPEPKNFEELAHSVDPAILAKKNEDSSRQAIIYTLFIVFGSLVLNIGLAAIFRSVGGPECDAGEALWLCTRTQQLTWSAFAAILPFGGMLLCAVIMVVKLYRYLRWRTWMGAFWILVPYSMIWGINILQIVAGAL